MNVTYIENNSELNKLRKTQKKTKERTLLLFVSLWDKASENLLKNIEKSKKRKNVYVVNTFDVPHSTSIFKINKLPALVHLKDKTSVEDYLPHIYDRLV